MALAGYGCLKNSANNFSILNCFVSDPVHIVNLDGDPQEEYDKLYRVMTELLDTYFPERTVTITSADPPYCTPAIKYMLRRKNRLMRSGHVEKAGGLEP